MLIKSAIAEGVKRVVLTSSSSTIIGDYWKHPKSEYDENDYAPSSLSLYENSKLVQENVARSCASGKLELITLHPGMTLG